MERGNASTGFPACSCLAPRGDVPRRCAVLGLLPCPQMPGHAIALTIPGPALAVAMLLPPEVVSDAVLIDAARRRIEGAQGSEISRQ